LTEHRAPTAPQVDNRPRGRTDPPHRPRHRPSTNTGTSSRSRCAEQSSRHFHGSPSGTQ
jgi:hypothetical protein